MINWNVLDVYRAYIGLRRSYLKMHTDLVMNQ